jgi:hypothetical protein
METDIIFKNTGDPWLQEEDEQLNKLYNIDMLDIIEISKIHNRAPGGIISRLCKHNYIPNRISARGYIMYKNSNLYKQIVSSGDGRKRERKKDKNDEKLTDIDNKQNKIKLYHSKNKDLYEEVKQIKNEIIELKTTIKELVEMMKAVYDFEDA